METILIILIGFISLMAYFFIGTLLNHFLEEQFGLNMDLPVMVFWPIMFPIMFGVCLAMKLLGEI